MAACFGHRIDHLTANFIGELVQLLECKSSQVRQAVYPVQQIRQVCYLLDVSVSVIRTALVLDCVYFLHSTSVSAPDKISTQEGGNNLTH